MGKAVDRYIAANYVKGKVDAAFKEAKAEAEDELARLNEENGTTEVASQLFPGAATFKYSRTRRKIVSQYSIKNAAEFGGWCRDNLGALTDYAMLHADDFARWWFEETGEEVDGIARIEYEEAARTGPPKLYGYDEAAVEARLEELGGWLEGANRLLLGGDES